MKKIIYIADPEILAIPIAECNEPLIDAKNSDELLYGPPPESELTAPCYTKMRKSVFEKLCQAQKELPNGWRFQIFEGFRSLEVQQILFDEVYERVLTRIPNGTPKELFQETTRLISPVTNFDGTKNIPAHNTGAAIDIEILTETGELLDMGMTAKEWNSVNPDLCLTDCDIIDDNIKQNRRILLDLMQSHGFVNYPTEWWHFSYGDRYWAYHKNAKAAIYGSADCLDVMSERQLQ
jgi:D-alanyl-D-alanine dipeptidase